MLWWLLLRPSELCGFLATTVRSLRDWNFSFAFVLRVSRRVRRFFFAAARVSNFNDRGPRKGKEIQNHHASRRIESGRITIRFTTRFWTTLRVDIRLLAPALSGFFGYPSLSVNDSSRPSKGRENLEISHSRTMTTTALPPLPFSPSRLRSYILRLPLFTRLILIAIAVFWALELQSVWDVAEWGALRPSKVGLTSSKYLSGLIAFQSLVKWSFLEHWTDKI